MDILFVCTGNICRSPAAEGIARKVLSKKGKKIGRLDSAGTSAWHIGNPPHINMCKVAADRGFPIDDLRARQVQPSDFAEFDWIIVMDSEHLEHIEGMKKKHGGKAKVRKLREEDVPDPFYGGIQGFHFCFDYIQEGIENLDL